MMMKVRVSARWIPLLALVSSLCFMLFMSREIVDYDRPERSVVANLSPPPVYSALSTRQHGTAPETPESEGVHALQFRLFVAPTTERIFALLRRRLPSYAPIEVLDSNWEQWADARVALAGDIFLTLESFDGNESVVQRPNVTQIKGAPLLRLRMDTTDELLRMNEASGAEAVEKNRLCTGFASSDIALARSMTEFAVCPQSFFVGNLWADVLHEEFAQAHCNSVDGTSGKLTNATGGNDDDDDDDDGDKTTAIVFLSGSIPESDAARKQWQQHVAPLQRLHVVSFANEHRSTGWLFATQAHQQQQQQQQQRPTFSNSSHICAALLALRSNKKHVRVLSDSPALLDAARAIAPAAASAPVLPSPSSLRPPQRTSSHEFLYVDQDGSTVAMLPLHPATRDGCAVERLADLVHATFDRVTTVEVRKGVFEPRDGQWSSSGTSAGPVPTSPLPRPMPSQRIFVNLADWVGRCGPEETISGGLIYMQRYIFELARSPSTFVHIMSVYGIDIVPTLVSRMLSSHPRVALIYSNNQLGRLNQIDLHARQHVSNVHALLRKFHCMVLIVRALSHARQHVALLQAYALYAPVIIRRRIVLAPLSRPNMEELLRALSLRKFQLASQQPRHQGLWLPDHPDHPVLYMPPVVSTSETDASLLRERPFSMSEPTFCIIAIAQPRYDGLQATLLGLALVQERLPHARIIAHIGGLHRLNESSTATGQALARLKNANITDAVPYDEARQASLERCDFGFRSVRKPDQDGYSDLKELVSTKVLEMAITGLPIVLDPFPVHTRADHFGEDYPLLWDCMGNDAPQRLADLLVRVVADPTLYKLASQRVLRMSRQFRVEYHVSVLLSHLVGVYPRGSTQQSIVRSENALLLAQGVSSDTQPDRYCIAWSSIATCIMYCNASTCYKEIFDSRALGNTVQDITLVSMGTLERLKGLREFDSEYGRRWAGPTVIVLYSTPAESAEARLWLLQEQESFRNTLIALFVNPGDHPAGTDPLLSSFPINSIRNMAIDKVHTDSFLYVDLDFVPSNETYAELSRALPELCEKCIFTLPSFEVRDCSEKEVLSLLPRNWSFKTLASAWKQQLVSPWKCASSTLHTTIEEHTEVLLRDIADSQLHQLCDVPRDNYCHGHELSQFTRWSLGDFQLLPLVMPWTTIEEALTTCNQWVFEPYGLMRTSDFKQHRVPEAHGAMLLDKVLWHKQLYLARFSWYTVPHAHLIHVPHKTNPTTRTKLQKLFTFPFISNMFCQFETRRVKNSL